MATVTYSGPPQFLTSQTWREVQPSLLSQSPLRNLHWKTASRPNLRTIQQLDVTFVPLDTLRDEYTSQVPTTVLEKPLLHVYILACEESDLDTYRTTFKKLIKDWHSLVSSKKNQDWMIIQIVRSDVRVQSGKLFQLKGLVSDKLKADFNSDKRDRCGQLTWSSSSPTPVAWADVTNKLKDSLLQAFDAAITQREDEVKRSEGQRSMPGWNFCTFFILKESLATSFSSVGLLEDATVQYDELEASFLHVMKDKNMSWFGPLINTSSEDAASPLLSINKKPYRDLILANNISIFDFRIYLLARQCELLAQASRFTEICRKAAAFLGAFGRRLREVENTLPLFFIEFWRYSAALSVVDQCEAWASVHRAVTQEGPHSEAGKGELLELARSQLDVIGVKLGHLPKTPPFSNSISPSSTPLSPESPSEDAAQSKESPFMGSITDPERFYNLYTDTTNRAIDLYARGGRKKFALKLHGSLAALDRHRGLLPAALSTFSSLPAHYQLHQWTSLEFFMYSRALDTHELIGKDKDKEWLTIFLSFLKAFVDSSETEIMTASNVMKSQIPSPLSTILTIAAQLETDLIFPDHPTINIIPSSGATIHDSTDGSNLDITILNRLPFTLPVTSIQMTLLGQDSQKLVYSMNISSLPPGKSQHTLFCPLPVSGPHILEITEIRVAKLVLQWVHWKQDAASKSKKQHKGRPTLIRVPRDPSSFDVNLLPSQRVELDGDRTITVTVFSGRDMTQRAVLTLSAPGVTFRHNEATLLPGAAGTLTGEKDKVVLQDIPAKERMTFSIPLNDPSFSQNMKIGIQVEYSTSNEHMPPRSFRVSRSINTSLPISMFVEDFFQGDKLFSKFTISTTSSQHLRIASAELRPPEGSDIVVAPCAPPARVLTVTATQPAIFLFLVRSSQGSSSGEPMHLRVSFRLLREEIEDVIDSVIDTALSNSERATSTKKLLLAQLEKDGSWLSHYVGTGTLQLSLLAGDSSDFADEMKLLQEELLKPRSPQQVGHWREIVLPVDVPSMDIVVSANLELVPVQPDEGEEQQHVEKAGRDEQHFYAGEPISAKLTLSASYRWGTMTRKSQEDDRRYSIRFDIQAMVNDWLVSGRKRGDILISEEDHPYSVEFTLVALHHGLLSLPKVAVTSLPVSGGGGGGGGTMGSVAAPSVYTQQLHAAKRVLILPRVGRTTFMVDIGE